MQNREAEQVLTECGIKPTAIRVLIYNTIVRMNNAFALMDIETVLETVDKSTIFRTLTLFQEQGVIHSFEDGSGSLKYCLCQHVDSCTIQERHCHFYCQQCKQTYCLDNIIIPSVKLPEGFEVQNINYIIKGVCPACKIHK